MLNTGVVLVNVMAPWTTPSTVMVWTGWLLLLAVFVVGNRLDAVPMRERSYSLPNPW